MAEVTVSQFAEVLKVPVERLITQLDEAGIKVEGADDIISDEAKMELLTHLRRAHGRDEDPAAAAQDHAAAQVADARSSSPRRRAGRARSASRCGARSTYLNRDRARGRAASSAGRARQVSGRPRKRCVVEARTPREDKRASGAAANADRVEAEVKRKADDEARLRAEEEARRLAEAREREKAERERAGTSCAAGPAHAHAPKGRAEAPRIEQAPRHEVRPPGAARRRRCECALQEEAGAAQPASRAGQRRRAARLRAADRAGQARRAAARDDHRRRAGAAAWRSRPTKSSRP